uniref:Uncharacterized protein n=1 Tax=uncultured bacterium Contig1777 TaxID=1393514 RepID=W0FVC1_9BACT|nr:hypothetical protein [uncultured bacterium Contig1777]
MMDEHEGSEKLTGKKLLALLTAICPDPVRCFLIYKIVERKNAHGNPTAEDTDHGETE